MPISLDFPEITDAFRRFLLLPVRQIAHSFEALSTWLDRRVKLADRLEQSSRGFPVVRFEGDVVMLLLDQVQWGALASDGRAGNAAADAAGRFAQGIGGIRNSVTQELILPNAIGAVAAMLDGIAQSMERFAAPSADLLFGHSGVAGGDPARRRAGDLWGEAALAFRTVAGSTGALRTLAGHLGKVFKPSPDLSTPGGQREARPGDPADAAGGYILAALIVLPQLPAFVSGLWDALVITVKIRMIEAFARIEARVNEVRAKVISFFFDDVRALLRKVLSFTTATILILMYNIRFFGRFALGYGGIAAGQLQAWFKAVADYLNGYIDTINTVLTALAAVLEFDLSPIITALLVPSLGPTAGLIPSLTLDDVITFGTDAARATARVSLTAISAAVALAGSQLPGPVSRRLAALPGLFAGGLRPQPSLPPETGAISWPGGFPDLYDSFFRPGVLGFHQAIDHLGDVAARRARDVAGVGAVAVNILGDEFAAQADAAAAMGSDARFAQIAATADRQARGVFGADADQRRAGLALTDPVADAFEGWLALGGFEALGAVIPAYARQMREMWQDRAEHGEEARVRIDITSPRILAQHAALACASVKQVVIDATGKAVDADLAAEVARQFRGCVQQAYLDGQERLRVYADAVAA